MTSVLPAAVLAHWTGVAHLRARPLKNSPTADGHRPGHEALSIWELIEYGSSIITLHPGDVINSGTSGGTSSGAFAKGTRKGYLQPGEAFEASIEGIGTVRHPVVAGAPLPADLTGSQLPAVDTYRLVPIRHGLVRGAVLSTA